MKKIIKNFWDYIVGYGNKLSEWSIKYKDDIAAWGFACTMVLLALSIVAKGWSSWDMVLFGYLEIGLLWWFFPEMVRLYSDSYRLWMSRRAMKEA